MKKPNRLNRIPALFIIAFAALMLIVYAPGIAEAIDQSEYEYESYEGLHQEEWYDPSDWFDEEGEGISYETDWYDYTYAWDDYYDEDVYGYYDYYEDDEYLDDDVDNGYYDDYDDWDYDYYTDEWYEDEDLF
ncbi:MAG: hypothetical protein R6U50_09015 [Desulfobacterales bacterium]